MSRSAVVSPAGEVSPAGRHRVASRPLDRARSFAAGALAFFAVGCGGDESGYRVEVARCPSRMVEVGGFCIDRHEARVVMEDGRPSSAPAVETPPSVELDYRAADRACRGAGFRLCSHHEWTRACRGTDARVFPYGDHWEAHRCNNIEARDDLDAFQVAASGSFPGCVTPEGVFDLSGNVWEWTSEPSESGESYELRGGGVHNGEGQSKCEINDRYFQPADSHEGYRGFRCCAPIRG